MERDGGAAGPRGSGMSRPTLSVHILTILLVLPGVPVDDFIQPARLADHDVGSASRILPCTMSTELTSSTKPKTDGLSRSGVVDGAPRRRP
jgi:hypothetical protein